MNDRGRISDKRKEQAVSSERPRDVVRAQAQARQEQSKGGEKAQCPSARKDFRRTLLEAPARETREAHALRNISQDRHLVPRSTGSDGKSGPVGSPSQENVLLHNGTRKGMDRTEYVQDKITLVWAAAETRREHSTTMRLQNQGYITQEQAQTRINESQARYLETYKVYEDKHKTTRQQTTGQQ